MLKTKGWGPWKKRFYSFCSAHRIPKEGCKNCNSGTWSNVWSNGIECFIFKITPKIWLFFKNL